MELKLLTKKEVIEWFDISLTTLNRWMKEKDFPFLKLGKGKYARVRFEREKIMKWLKKNLQR